MTDEGKLKEVIELSDEEVAQRAQTLAAKNIEIAIMKSDLKEATSSARANIKAVQATIDELADQVNTKQMTRYVDRQPGLPFDGPDEDDEEANPTDGEGEEGASIDDLNEAIDAIVDPSGDGSTKMTHGWTTGANPGPVPEGAEITDPAGVMGPPRPPAEGGKPTRKKKTKGKK